jgi:hypothetical protein
MLIIQSSMYKRVIDDKDSAVFVAIDLVMSCFHLLSSNSMSNLLKWQFYISEHFSQYYISALASKLYAVTLTMLHTSINA